MYALKGVEVDEFQGNKQYKGSMLFIARSLPNHPLSRHVGRIKDMEFTSINSNQKMQKNLIDNFSDLKTRSEELQEGSTLWSDVFCSLKAVRFGNAKVMYLSCPHCKKKVSEEEGSNCLQCGNKYHKAKYRYILNINFVDSHENIWASAYDEIG